ncbi:hypothetical protein FSW04_18950 [Baekduia soli]|uniref:Uncharacterized protein n=1 Tax=Baekduia soli TaxID=496014 RepID=A0A5B8U9Z6_9ACTN|nr:hypothetical protein [Baekduia soli]QEC49441.1 hypothetical protein FSW04_18950 [Baekduia soli]
MLMPGRLALGALALLVAGCVIAAVGTTTALDAIGLVIAGIGAVLLVSAAFLAVGQSEDRDREQRGGS